MFSTPFLFVISFLQSLARIEFTMNCLLINPFYPISETPSPPLGLAYLAAALESAKCPVKILDFVVYPYGKPFLENEMNEFSPHIVGVTSVTMNFNVAIKIIQDVKRIDPEVITVMGGPHVTFCSQETLAAYPELDIVVLGEGEDTLVRLAQSTRKDWPEIDGIVYRNNDRIHTTQPKSRWIDVDTLSLPARHLLPLGRYRALGMPLTMTTSRGCPFQCIFCVGRKMVGAKVRYRNPISVVDELESLAALGFHQINVADDLFTANERHCLNICDEILQRNIRVRWTSFARVDTVSMRVLERMKSAGCTAVSFGIESGNADILKTIRKGITRDQVVQAVSWCTEAGIQPHGSFILGLPGETPDTIRETLAFGDTLRDLGLSYGFHMLAPFPGTRVREESASYGIRILSSDWSDYHANRAIVETPDVSQNMMNAIVMEWEDDFNRQLGQIADRIKSGDATEDEAFILVNLERTVLLYDMMMKQVLETAGQTKSPESPIDPDQVVMELADRIFPELENTTKEKLIDTLKTALGRNDIRYSSANGMLGWDWTTIQPALNTDC